MKKINEVRSNIFKKPGTAYFSTPHKAQKFQNDFKVSSILFQSTRTTQWGTELARQKGDPLGFFNIHSVAKYQNNEGFIENCFEKVSQCRKKSEEGELLVSSGF